MSKIKILIVDDSAFMRKVIKDILETDPDLEVIGIARNGQDALEKLPQLNPNVITLDVEMPVLDGLSTLEKIVENYSIPVVMLSSTTKTGTENTLTALEKGAFDFIAKPSGSISLDIYKIQEELIKKIKSAYQYSRKNQISISFQKNQIDVKPITNKPYCFNSKLEYIILIGTSTGGPRALQQVLISLPKLGNSAILVVQHMPPSFTKSLAYRLDQLTLHHVVEAKNGEIIQEGHVYIAPGGYHMEVKALQKKLAIHLHQEPPRGGHRPSVDVLFESALHIVNHHVIMVVMTGMGRDGTEGLKKLKQARKIYAIAENESSCVVYGMPRSVIEANLIDEVAPLEQIHLVLERLTKL